MYQRASQGGGGSAPTIETKQFDTNASITFTVYNGWFQGFRGGLGQTYSYQSPISGYVENGELTVLAKGNANNTATYNSTTHKLTLTNAGAAGVEYLYKID